MLASSIIIKNSPVDGRGLFASRPIKRGEIVWRLDTSEPKLTYAALQQLSERERSLAFQFGNEFIICHDGSEYMNHGCDPNTWWASDTELAARRDITSGEEITYDYVTADISPAWQAPWRCRCGSALCRHIISSEDYKDQQWQKRYGGHLPSWVLEAATEQLPGARSASARSNRAD